MSCLIVYSTLYYFFLIYPPQTYLIVLTNSSNTYVFYLINYDPHCLILLHRVFPFPFTATPLRNCFCYLPMLSLYTISPMYVYFVVSFFVDCYKYNNNNLIGI